MEMHHHGYYNCRRKLRKAFSPGRTGVRAMDITSSNRARDLRLLLLVFLLACVAGLEAIGRGRWREGAEEAVVRDDIAEGTPRFEAIQTAAEKIAPLHVPLGEPKPGEWLSRHPESGQTFAAYRASDPNRPDVQHTTMYLQPLGSFDADQERLLRTTAELLGLFYGVPVKTQAPIALERIPPRARRVHPTWGDAQILAPYVLDMLQTGRPEDAVAVLALTTADLWPGEDRNFVFGQASLSQRVGVWSLYRQGDPRTDFPTCLRRTLKTAAHETGHMLGIRHCTACECCMNGSNHRAEADSRPLWFCAEDERKVWWSCKLDPAVRYRRLAEFAAANDLAPEARFWRDSLAALEHPRLPDRWRTNETPPAGKSGKGCSPPSEPCSAGRPRLGPGRPKQRRADGFAWSASRLRCLRLGTVRLTSPERQRRDPPTGCVLLRCSISA
jgi:archaemetzincin